MTEENSLLDIQLIIIYRQPRPTPIHITNIIDADLVDLHLLCVKLPYSDIDPTQFHTLRAGFNLTSVEIVSLVDYHLI